ncbi:MAG: hypothetical protein OEV87_05725 [Phycisphaerae bacterium]|nr:hypothetical protein [Phycisphaerae bacterium]
MAREYSIETCKQLEAAFDGAQLYRPMRIDHYDAGIELEYEMTPVEPGPQVTVSVLIDKFVGGGFAGQVYKVILTKLQINGDIPIEVGHLKVGNQYAMKILIPPSSGSLFFRNFLYAVGFQGSFQLQVNPTAARAGALWQKFIRAAAQVRFGDEKCVNDIHATFVDSTLGSCGEISDWVEGRTWRLEVDDHLDQLKCWKKGQPAEDSTLGSPEYRSKYTFMTEFVKLLHEVGAHEFARQYEWTTCKSQPNALKRIETNAEPARGLVAVDFRAGLTLLPFLPMSPGDFKLIGQGLARGSLVQFDRGDLSTLKAYLDNHPQMREYLPNADTMLNELTHCEIVYRNSVPDVTHNGLQLLYDGKLWNRLFDSAVTGWKTRNLFDPEKETVFRNSKLKTILFFLLGLVPFLGRFGRKLWAKADWRKHYASMLSSFGYFRRAFNGKMAEKLIGWHRAGRVDAETAMALYHNAFRFLLHVPVSIFPAGLHRFMTDPAILKNKLHFVFVRPLKLYFNAHLREEWLRDMVTQGKKKHILSDDDADTILSQVNEPYIQKYLVSLVVHLMTLPVTQIVSAIVAYIFYIKHPEMPEKERAAAVLGILALFQIIPISPGSFCRGLYTTILAIRDRNFKDYNIALFLSYFKYVGYLAFPIQMTYHYPAMARFMAAHWATDAVHIVPVFGERGALFEHWIFCAFYNWPLTVRRRMKRIGELRADMAVRLWHMPAAVIAVAGVFAVSHYAYFTHSGMAPTTDNKWFMKPLFCLVFFLPLATGWAVTRFAGGLSRIKRAGSSAICGLCIGIVYSLAAFMMERQWDLEQVQLLVPMIWRAFAMAIFCTIGALITEIRTPDPDLK